MHGKSFINCAAAAAFAFCVSGLTANAWAQDAAPKKKQKTITIGDKAPDIDIAHWLKGVEMDRSGKFEPITKFEKDHIYVLEFWATWCGPCIASMPHISGLQEKYKDYDVTVIGVSDESLPKVMEFLFKTDKRDGKLNNDRTNYTLTTDPDESVKNDYFRAAGQRGIPCSFIIGKDSRIEWIGHPMGMDGPLENVVHDTWDRDAFKMEFENRANADKEAAAAAKEIRAAREAGDWGKILKTLDARLEKDPKNFNVMMEKFVLLLTSMNEPKRAYAFGDDIVKANWDEAQMLNAISWYVVDDGSVKTRNLAFALKAAERANELTESGNAAIIDTLARVYYEKGDLAMAVKWQRKAAEVAGDDEMGADIRKTLEKYEKASKKGY